MIDTGMPCVSSKMAENRSVASIVCRPHRLACSSASLKRSLVDGATRSSRPGDARQQPQVLLQRLENLVRVQLEVAHDLAEHVPFDLRKRETDVLVRQQRVLATAGLVERAIHDALGRLGQLVLRDVEVLHHDRPPDRSLRSRQSKIASNGHGSQAQIRVSR